MPAYPVYLLALVLRRFAGRLPLAKSVKGNVSDDPRVEAEDLREFFSVSMELKMPNKISG